MAYFLGFGTPSRDQFAALIIRRLRQAGYYEPVYNRAEFMITTPDPGSCKLNLGTVYAEFCRSSRAQRNAFLQRYIASLSDRPEPIFDEMRHLLRPVVRDSLYIKSLYYACGVRPAYREVTEHLAALLGTDDGDRITTVSPERLAAWGVTFDEAIEIACENLWSISNEDFEPVAPGVWLSPWKDNFDLSRMLRPDLIWQLPVKGNHVAFAPDRDNLIITGSDDDAGLCEAVKLTRYVLENSTRRASGIPSELQGRRWEPFQPASGAAAPLIADLWRRTIATAYEEQREILASYYQKAGRNIYVSKVLHFRTQDGEISSLSVWTRGEHILLPRTDFVHFATADANLGMAPWERVVAVAGKFLQPIESYPPRFEVTGFPAPDQLAALQLVMPQTAG